MKKIVLDLCGGSGAWSKPYKEAGYDVRLITLPDYDVTKVIVNGNELRFWTNLDDRLTGHIIKSEDVYGILAAPPCIEFSIAKNHNLKREFEEGLVIVRACQDIINQCNPKFSALENPVGYLSKWLGKENYSFQPWWFGDPWTKKTALWGVFNKPRRKYSAWEVVPKNPNLYIRPGRGKPSIAFLHKSSKKFIKSFNDFDCETDADFRAITPQGFAKAFFEANR